MKKIIVPIVVALILMSSLCSVSAAELPVTINKGSWRHFDLWGFWESSPGKPRGVDVLFSGQPSKEVFTLTLCPARYFQYVLHFPADAEMIEIEGHRFKVLRVDQKEIIIEKVGKIE